MLKGTKIIISLLTLASACSSQSANELIAEGSPDGGATPPEVVVGPDGGDDDLPPDSAVQRPTGIYLLGVKNSVSEIRDYDFVDGYALRTGWTSLEASEGSYDFSKIDEFVVALDAIDQKLSLVVFSQKVPQYLLDDPAVELYESFNQNNNGSTFFTAAPWDPIALERYELFMKALADHEVESLDAGGPVPLRDHPALNGIGAQVVGLGGIRDPKGAIAAIPSYTREAFTEAAQRSLQAPITEFAGKFVHLAFFGISDDIQAPSLDEHLLAALNDRFNSEVQPRLGFFAENLACDTPSATTKDVLFAQKETTYTMFQMLQAWQDPFQNAEKTDVCNSETNGPDIGIQYGLDNFDTHYFEVYPADIDHEPYWPALQASHDRL